MKNFSDVISESQQLNSVMNRKDIDKYIDRLERQLPKDVYLVLVFLSNKGILDKKTIDVIIDGNKSQLQAIANAFSVDVKELLSIYKIFKANPEWIRLIPVFQSSEECQDLLAGKKTVEDITLDLDSEKGRAKIAKQYMSLVLGIANKYKGSGLEWNSVVSAGMLGLMNAMKDYHRSDYYANLGSDDNAEEMKKYKRLTFKQYAGWRIKQQILNDINNYSRTVRISQYQYDKNKREGNTLGNFNNISIDNMYNDDDDKGRAVDRLLKNSSSVIDTDSNDSKKILSAMDNMLKKKFNNRDIVIFYKSFGLFDYDEMKQNEIAKEFNITAPAVNYVIKRIIKYIQDDPKAKPVLQALYNQHFESLMLKNFDKTREDILEAFIDNDIHILLEGIVKYNDKQVFNNEVGSILDNYNDESREFIIKCLENDFEFIDENYTANKALIVDFLENLYPTERLKNLTDLDILNKMVNISDTFKEHNL